MLNYIAICIICVICFFIGFIIGMAGNPPKPGWKIFISKPKPKTITNPVAIPVVCTKEIVSQGIDEEAFNNLIKTFIESTSRKAVDVFISKNTDGSAREAIISSLASRYLEQWKDTLTFDRFDSARPVLYLICRRSEKAPDGFAMDFLWDEVRP